MLALIAIALPLTASIACLAMALVVLLGAPERRLARMFAVFATDLALWNLLIGLQAIPGFAGRQPELLGVLRWALLLMPATGFHIAVFWAGRTELLLRVMVVVGYALSGLLIIASSAGLVWDGWVHYSWGSIGRPAPLYLLFVAFSLVWLGAMTWVARHSMRTASDAAVRLRMQQMYLASLVGVPLGLSNFLPVYGLGLPPLGGLGCVLLMSVFAYGTFRDRMLDLDTLVIKLVVPGLALLVVLPLVLAVVWLARYSPANPILASALVVCCSVAAMLSYARVRAVLERVIERSFFPKRHQGRRAIEAFSRSVVELAQRERLGQELTATLAEGLGLTGAALYVGTPDHGMRREAAYGAITGPPALSAHEIDASYARAAGWETCVPIHPDRDAAGGLIVLGAKRSGAAIDDLDATILGMVASQVAIALQNLAQVHEIERQKAEIEALKQRVEAENVALRAEVRQHSAFREIIGSSPALQEVLGLVEKAARSEVSILITGETGTGKELIARAIHELSRRSDGPLISVNCPAIPQALAEAELFGAEQGAYTGATSSRPGWFELADGGTIFLDEIAELPMAIQIKLLRVLQEREIQRLGGRRVQKVDVRVVAASNRDLRQAIARGAFREDLYHRLATIVATLPALRERSGDIDMLAVAFLDRAATTYQKSIRGFSADALAALRAYNWPGNIRELQNVVERAVLLCDGAIVTAAHLADLAPGAGTGTGLSLSLREEKVRRIRQALLEAGGNQAEAARRLGLSRSNLFRMMKSLGLKSLRTLQ